MDTGDYAHAGSDNADRMGSQQEETQLPSVSIAVSSPATATASAVDPRSVPPGEDSSTQEKFKRASDGSTRLAHEERSLTAADANHAVISPATEPSNSPSPSVPVTACEVSPQEMPERVSQETASGSGSIGADTKANINLRPAREQQDASMPSASGKVSYRRSTSTLAVDHNSTSPGQSLSAQDNPHRTDGASSQHSNRQRLGATADKSRTVISQAFTVIRSSSRLSQPKDVSGAAFQDIPACGSKQNVSQDAPERPDPKIIAGADTATRPAGQHDEISAAFIPANVLNRSAAQISTPTAPPSADTIPSGITLERIQIHPSEHGAFQSSVLNVGVKTYDEGKTDNHFKSQQKAKPFPSVPGNGRAHQTVDPSAADRMERLPRPKASAPARAQLLDATSSLLASGTSSHPMLDETGMPIPLPAQVSIAPRQRPASSGAPINELPRMTGDVPEVDALTNGRVNRDGKPSGDQTNAFVSSRSTISSLPAWAPAPATQSGNSPQQAFAHGPEEEPSGSHLADTVLKMGSLAEASRSNASLPVNAFVPAVPGGGIGFGTTAMPADEQTVYPAQNLNGQKSGPWTKNESSDSSAPGVGVHAAQVVLDGPPHVTPDRSVADHAAPGTTAASAKPLTQAAAPIVHATQVAPADSQSAVAPVSNAKLDRPASTAVPVVAEVLVLQQNLPIVPFLADGGSGSQSLGNPGKKQGTSAIGSENLVIANPADRATSKTSGGTSRAGDASQHSVQSNVQPSSSSQVDPAHAADAVPKAPDASASQAQAVIVQAGIPGAPLQHPGTAVSDVASRPTDPREVPESIHTENSEAVAASSINSAKLMQTIHETEMHVGMRSTEFGDISIRTSISQQQLVAQISLDHSDLSKAISAHVSTIQTKLGEDSGLHTSIEVHNQGSSLSHEPGQSSQREQRNFTSSAPIENALLPAEENAGPNLGSLPVALNGNRLDIRA
jgi:hypothetical protein